MVILEAIVLVSVDRLNRNAVPTTLEPRRHELQALLAGLMHETPAASETTLDL